jgi:gamma-glutamyltranspeptidase/glutathione hydrolase
VKLAREGFVVSETLARSLNSQLRRREEREERAKPGLASPETNLAGRDDLGSGSESLGDFPESVAVFRKPDETPWRDREDRRADRPVLRIS